MGWKGARQGSRSSATPSVIITLRVCLRETPHFENGAGASAWRHLDGLLVPCRAYDDEEDQFWEVELPQSPPIIFSHVCGA